MRDAAVECLEEVYRVYGEQLIDIINRHSLRPAHVNAIYTRLQQLGADVAPTAAASTANDQSAAFSQQSKGKAGTAADDYDTATSAAAETSDQRHGSKQPAAAPAGHAARRQAQQQAAVEDSVSSMLEFSRSLGSAAAGGAAKSKRGGYKVRCMHSGWNRQNQSKNGSCNNNAFWTAAWATCPESAISIARLPVLHHCLQNPVVMCACRMGVA